MQLSQEAIKVDLGVQEDIRSYVSKLEKVEDSALKVRSLMNSKIKEYNDLANQIENGAKLADQIYDDAFRTLSEADKFLNNLEKKLKELGMDLGDFPNSQALIMLIDEAGSMLSSLSAARNMSAPRLGSQV